VGKLFADLFEGEGLNTHAHFHQRQIEFSLLHTCSLHVAHNP
jgi:hypothetical protein